MTPEMRAAVHAVDVIARVRRRLVKSGGIAELDVLARLSADELDLLVWQEVHG